MKTDVAGKFLAIFCSRYTYYELCTTKNRLIRRLVGLYDRVPSVDVLVGLDGAASLDGPGWPRRHRWPRRGGPEGVLVEH